VQTCRFAEYAHIRVLRRFFGDVRAGQAMAVTEIDLRYISYLGDSLIDGSGGGRGSAARAGDDSHCAGREYGWVSTARPVRFWRLTRLEGGLCHW
jgi:hypothetical protein